MTPVEYINSYRVNRAILLLISNSGLSIEQIAELTGFESSAYFRRVFKAQTGKTPREYRTSAIEI
jgi:transcriptional regulator GlxA family with amidase domain